MSVSCSAAPGTPCSPLSRAASATASLIRPPALGGAAAAAQTGEIPLELIEGLRHRAGGRGAVLRLAGGLPGLHALDTRAIVVTDEPRHGSA